MLPPNPQATILVSHGVMDPRTKYVRGDAFICLDGDME